MGVLAIEGFGLPPENDTRYNIVKRGNKWSEKGTHQNKSSISSARLKYCQGKGYEVAYHFSEAYSGLSLERPELDKLRELVRAEAIDVLVCHSLDRLTRDPGHGVIITQELEKHSVKLEAVTEDVDFIDDIDLAARQVGGIVDLFPQVPDFFNATVAGGIDFNNV